MTRKPMGRPSLYTPALADRICLRLVGGESLRAICADPRMPSETAVTAWLGKYADFNEKYGRARLLQADIIADETLEIVDNEPDPVRARLRFDARRWYACHLTPKRYGVRPQHDVAEIGAVLITTGVVRDGDA